MNASNPGFDDKKRFILLSAVIIAASFGLRLLLASYTTGFRSDQMLFVQWTNAIEQYGLAGAFLQNGNINYPPLFLLLMDGYNHALAWFGLAPEAGSLSFKLLLVLIDLGAMLLAAWILSRMPIGKWRYGVLLLFAFNPALMTDSAVWGQVDLLHSMLMVTAVVLVLKRPWASGVFMALALMTKFQAVAVLPVIGIYLLVLLFRERKWQPLLAWGIGLAAPIALMAAYFGANDALGKMFSQAYADAVGSFTGVTVNAMNIWYNLMGVGPAENDTQLLFAGITLRIAGLAIFVLAVALICVYVWLASRRQASQAVLLRAAAVVNFAFFMLPTEIHERYGIPALVFAVFAVLRDWRWAAGAIGLTVTTLINLLVVLHTNGGGFGGRKGNGNGGGFGGGGRGGMGVGRGAVGDTSTGQNFGGRMGQGGEAGGGFGGMNGGGHGASNVLTGGYTWVAALNLLLLLWMFWLLWRDYQSSRKKIM